MNPLLTHPALERMNPARLRLVRMAAPLAALNPFAADGVTITPALLYAECNSKIAVAYELVRSGILSGEITQGTRVVIPSSGNTGLDAAMLLKALGVRGEVLMPQTAPPAKVGLVSVLGYPIDTTLVSASTVTRAKELAALPGVFVLDQYGRREENRGAQKRHLAPKLWGAHRGDIDIVVASGGTLGTAGGLLDYIEERGLSTTVVLALCAPGEEIPAGRDEARIRREVSIGSVDEFAHRMLVTRFQAFLASYAMFSQAAEWGPGGPTSGEALSATLRFIKKHKDAGTLDQFRNKKDRSIRVVFLCPDDYRAYSDLYRAELNDDRDYFSPNIPVKRLLEEAV